MIKLDVEDYCQECLDFDPEKESVCLYSGDKICQCITTVRCKHRNRCKNIMQWFVKKKEGETNGDRMP